MEWRLGGCVCGVCVVFRGIEETVGGCVEVVRGVEMGVEVFVGVGGGRGCVYRLDNDTDQIQKVILGS